MHASNFAVFPKKDNRNYVEPDVTVVCDREKIDERGCNGAPEWVIEVVSPSSVKMDYERKKKLYQESDQAREYSFNETVEVGLYEDLCLDLKEMMAYLEG